MIKLLGAAGSLYSRERTRLLGVAAAVTIPVAAIVLVLDLIAWRSIDPPRPGVSEREFGTTVRAVDDSRFTTIAVARYVLGGAVYVLVVAIAFRPLRQALLAGGTPAPASAPQAGGALAGGIGLVVGARVTLSAAGSVAFATVASSGVLAYLALMNAVHAVGKIVTAPFLAALLAVVACARRRATTDLDTTSPSTGKLRAGSGA